MRRLLRPLPRRANLTRYPVLKWFAEHARRAAFLWSFKRANVMPSLYVGSVLAFLPVYGLQILLGFGLALGLRGNLTVMVALQMITNPLTLGPIYYGTHSLGIALIGALGYGDGATRWGTNINALVVGGIVAGLALALVVDGLWRLVAWEARRFRSQLQALHTAMRYRHGMTSRDDAPPGDG